MKHKLSHEESPDAKRQALDLLHMQMEDWLVEHQLAPGESNKTRLLADELIEQLSALDTIDSSEAEKLPFPFRLPFDRELSDVATSRAFSWLPPQRIVLLNDLRTKQEPALHLDIVIPLKCFGSRDFLNYAYHVKRAQYARSIAVVLVERGYGVMWSHEHNDPCRPVLLVQRNGAALHLHLSPPDEFAAPQRFRPQNNNLRSAFCTAATTQNEPPSPFYNANVLSDLVRRELDHELAEFLADKPTMKKAVLLLLAWMRSRGFTTRDDGVSEEIVTAWLLLLHRDRLINNTTVLIDILSAFFSSIVSTNWNEKRLSLAQAVPEERIARFQQFSPFVFLDFSGYLNLTRHLSKTAWSNVRDAASSALAKLNCFDDFDSLFNNPVPFQLAFDVFIKVTVSRDEVSQEEMRLRCERWHGVAKERVASLVTRALAARACLLDVAEQLSDTNKINNLSLRQPTNWELHDEPEPFTAQELHLVLGMRLLPGWQNAITRGPTAKSSEAAEFRTFWGDRCELRKFPDNAICEAVVWSAQSSSHVPFLICQHVLSKHLNVQNGSVEERSVFDETVLPRACPENGFDIVGTAFDKLSHTLRAVSGLPLAITNVAPVSSSLRRTAAYPPGQGVDECCKVVNGVAVPCRDVSPAWVGSVEVLLTLEQSGKWGEDATAIQKLSTAFYTALCAELTTMGLQAKAHTSHALVLTQGVLFRVVISYPKQLHLDDNQSSTLHRDLVLTPRLAMHLHSTSQQFAAFAPACRLASTWLATQQMADFIHELMVETMMAHVFIKPLTGHQPRSAFMGFAHWLRLMTSHNWLMRPLVVDLGNEWDESDLDAMQGHFVQMRPVLPAMVICTPEDRSGCLWTRDEPQPVMLKRMVQLAKSSLRVLQWNVGCTQRVAMQPVFRSPAMPCDAWVHLRRKHLVRRKRAATEKASVVRRKKAAEDKSCALPVCDYDPVQQYVQQLRLNMGMHALFLYDRLHGDRIAVVWKPDALSPRQQSVTGSLYRALDCTGGTMHLDKQVLIEDMLLMGRGLVRNVQLCS